MKIIVASTNPVKIAATRDAFLMMFPEEHFDILGISVANSVSSQPQNDQETLQGAWNRALGASQTDQNADFYVGIEGGIEEKNSEMKSFAWTLVIAKDGKIGKGRTGTFFLPPAVADLIKQGKELGEADDIIFNKTNSKQQTGAVGILTGNAVDRTRFYAEAVVLALIPFKNKKLYFDSQKTPPILR